LPNTSSLIAEIFMQKNSTATTCLPFGTRDAANHASMQITVSATGLKR